MLMKSSLKIKKSIKAIHSDISHESFCKEEKEITDIMNGLLAEYAVDIRKNIKIRENYIKKLKAQRKEFFSSKGKKMAVRKR